MPSYNISLNDALAQIVEQEIRTKKYANRSEFFRSLIRNQYVDTDSVIEEIPADDPDHKILRKREQKTKFIPLTQVIQALENDISHSS